jgi:electron transport complex protein RnfB
MHTVLAEQCTGCELCIAPCPVDCITLVPAISQPTPEANRIRFTAHTERVARRSAEQAALLATRKKTARVAESPALRKMSQ